MVTARISEETYSVELPKLMKGTTVTSANPPGCVWFTARVDGKLVGCCAAVKEGNKARLKSLVVLKEYRGYKIGRQLWDFRMRWLLSRGVRNFNGFASPHSQPMYLKEGFALKRKIIRKDRETWFMELKV